MDTDSLIERLTRAIHERGPDFTLDVINTLILQVSEDTAAQFIRGLPEKKIAGPWIQTYGTDIVEWRRFHMECPWSYRPPAPIPEENHSLNHSIVGAVRVPSTSPVILTVSIEAPTDFHVQPIDQAILNEIIEARTRDKLADHYDIAAARQRVDSVLIAAGWRLMS